MAFALAGMGAGLAGALMANFSRFVSPDMLHWTLSGDMIIMMVLGGVGTLVGPILTALRLSYFWKVSLPPGRSTGSCSWALLLLVVVLWTRGGIMALARFVGRRLSPAAKAKWVGQEMSVLLEVQGLVKRFGGALGDRRCFARPACRRDPRADRAKRGRQDDADQPACR